MSPKLHSAIIQPFLNGLESLQEAVISPHPQAEAINRQFQEVEKQFTEEILPISPEKLNPQLANIWNGLKTEIHRNLRLVKADLVFFESSLKQGKPPKTKRLCSHLAQLIGFCNFLLKEDRLSAE